MTLIALTLFIIIINYFYSIFQASQTMYNKTTSFALGFEKSSTPLTMHVGKQTVDASLIAIHPRRPI